MLFCLMNQLQTIADFTTSVPLNAGTDQHSAGHFTALKLDDFSAESIAATGIYCRKDFYKITLATGDATYHTGDKAYRIKPGEHALIFTNREVPYRWDVHTEYCSGYSCLFTEDFLPLHTYLRPSDWKVFDSEGPSVFQLNEEETAHFTAIFQKMIAEQESSYAHKYDLLFLYVLECIHTALKLETEAEPGLNSAAGNLTKSFKTLLARQFPLVNPFQHLEIRSAQDFADKLFVHTNHLNRTLKTVTGFTTTQLITERIMQEAQALLIHSNWTISQISASLGFDEPTHFTHAFKRYTGKTPSAIRQVV